ncbi:MAG: sigma-70 family RNA polymerase sigma factor [Planctomycetes bacterium]|nr:sigma-70 family RNA polymerase sigma factor [Planctomycetota bacterium]
MTQFSNDESSGRIEPTFETTHWSLVIGAGQVETRQRSMTVLCERYWLPLYAFLRRAGHSSHDAQDLTQSFFVKLLERDGAIDGADQERGRFRSYLLGALKHFVANQRTRQKAQKRGGSIPHLSLNYAAAEVWYQGEPAEAETPESMFRRRWALSVLDSVIKRLEKEYEAKGKAQLFRALKDCLTGDSRDISYDKLAAEVSMSPGAVKTAAHRLRKRYRELLKDEISQTVTCQEEVEDEINQLLNALSS